MRTTLIAGNWKMNGSLVENATLLQELLACPVRNKVEVLVCPPSIYLGQVASVIKEASLKLGAQDVSRAESGAYTGDVSAAMLREFDVSYAIVGHSERRQYQKETDEQVFEKAAQSLAQGIIPIVCVGESLEQREAGQTKQVIEKQVKPLLSRLAEPDWRNVVIAYEPVWAIGTGLTASAEQAQEIHAFIRAMIAEVNPDAAENIRILYGGSMKSKNAEELLACPDVDGGLIGGASLSATEFSKICDIAGN